MGYLVRKLKGKRTWKVQYRTSKEGRRHATDIPQTDYLRLGLRSDFSIEDVQARVKQLNAQEALKRIEEKRRIIAGRLDEEDLLLNAHLPPRLRTDFERHHIDRSGKKISNWRTARRLILEINLPIEDWDFHRSTWYRLFQSRCYSLDYVQKLLHILNLWGKYVSYHQRSFYAPIPSPIGRDKQRIVDTYESRATTKESLPLTPALLEKLRGHLKLEQHLWMSYSLWFGLRPGEVDSFASPPRQKTWERRGEVLWMYQPKLSGLPTKDRIKPIPLKYQEQIELAARLPASIARPLNKTLKKVLNGQYTCYAGRKGFVDLMLERGNSLEAISQWLGHRSLDRTWRFYKDKKKVLGK